MKLTIAIPALNEAASLSGVVHQAHQAAEALFPGDFEILVLDDGSTDQTRAVLATLLKQFSPTFRFLRNTTPSGFAAIQKQCFNEARGEWVFLLPADGEVPGSLLVAAASRFPDHDIVVTERSGSEGAKIPRDRRWYYFFLRYLLDVPYRDFGACLFICKEWAQIMPWQSRTEVLMTEMLVKARHLKARIVVIPVLVEPRRGGASKSGRRWRRLGSYLKDLAALAWWRINPWRTMG